MQSKSEAESQKWYCDRKANAVSLEPGDLVLARADAYRGRKLKDQWEEEPYEVEHQVQRGVRLRKCHKVQIVHCWPSVRQVLLWNG